MSEIFKLLWAKVIIALTTNMTGLYGWLAQKALKYGGQVLLDLLEKAWNVFQRNQKQEVAKKEMDKVNADPTKKVEDRAKAYEDYLNSGN